MAYKDFTWEKIEEELNYLNKSCIVFEKKKIKSIQPSKFLLHNLEIAKGLRVRSEKGKSEAIVFPILAEIWAGNKTKYKIVSGENLLADKAKGLNGECDFIFSKEPEKLHLTAPIFTLVEAKKDKIAEG